MSEIKTRAVRIHKTGGADEMKWEEVALQSPGPGEALIRVAAAGLNFIDVYHRTGLYPVPLPATLGLEGAGTVEEAGEGVSEVKPGDRVGYCVAGLGAYAEWRLAPAAKLIPLPDSISFEQAAGMLLKGMTAEYLIRRCCPVKAGDAVLFHAAAGGVGLLACQWLARIGARVIGTAGSEAKAALAREHGCAEVILYREEDVAKRVRELTDGRGVSAAFDSVGRATFEGTLDSLATRGMFVSFGNASGPVESVSPGVLAAKGSLFFTRPTLMGYCAEVSEMRESASALFAAVADGVKAEVRRTFPLKDAAEAHRALEARETTGATVLIPDA